MEQKWKWIPIGILAFTLTFTLVGFFVVPVFVKSVLVERLSASLHRDVLIQGIKFNPYLLSLKINNLLIRDKDGETFVSLRELYINLQLSSLLKRSLVSKELQIKQPYIRIVRSGDMDFNFSDLMQGERKGTTPMKFSLRQVKIIDGKIFVRDGVKEMEHTLTDIHTTVPFLSNLPEYAGNEFVFNVMAVLNGSPVSFSGKSRPFTESRQTLLHADIHELYIPRYTPYLPLNGDIDILSGRANVRTTVSYSQKTASLSYPELIFLQTFLTLDSVVVKHKEEEDEFLAIPELCVHNADVNMTNRKVNVNKVFTKNGSLYLRRLSDGTFNLKDIISPVRHPEQPIRPRKPWFVNIKDLQLKEFSIQNEDLTAVNPLRITLDNINILAKDLTTQKGKEGQLSFSSRWNQSGTVTATGGVKLSPVTADLKVLVSGIDISPLQSFFIKNPDFVITKANLHADGRLVLGSPEESKSAIWFQGESSLSDFVSIDRPSQHTFFTWRTLLLSDADIRYNPTEVHISQALLDGFTVNLLTHPDGTNDLRMLLAQDAEEKELILKEEEEVPEAGKERIPPVRIDTIRFQGGQVNFIDQYINPAFKSELKDIELTISDFSTEDTSPADIFLTGKVEGVFPLELTGRMNIFPEERYANLRLALNGYDMPSLSPYAGKYLGYTLKKGKLSLNLEYEVYENKLDGRNEIILDQFTLGDKVESPQAISLPIRFVTNFLKGRDGKIKLDLPVSGDLRDPKFEFEKVILNSAVNLATKVASSPISVLGNIFGRGEELTFLEFDYGTAYIDEKGTKKLNDLIRALYERPHVRLEIEGGAASEKDRETIRLCRFLDLLKAQKLRNMVESGRLAVPLREVRIHLDEYEKYLEEAYRTADFPKPKNIFGFVRDISAERMEKMLMDHLEVTDEELRSLAQERANRVRDYILENGEIDPERIFIVEPKIHQPGEDEKEKKSRVQFALK